MGVRPAELGEAEEVEAQYKTGSTECEEPRQVMIPLTPSRVVQGTENTSV